MQDSSREDKQVVIIGAGPAGLTAAYELCKRDVKSVVLEKEHVVGGISKTVSHEGYHFDIGGHRFFTKVKAVEAMWHEVLGDDFLYRTRMSSIFFDKKFFDYPLRIGNALRGLGLWESFMIGLSYMRAQLFPVKDPKTFEDWVSNRFGKRLFNTFFKTYTEKVWGMPCAAISAEWAAQRIKGLSLIAALKNALLKKQEKGKVLATLIDAFHYPRRGPGMMWEKVAAQVAETHSEVKMGADVERILWSKNGVESVEASVNGHSQLIEGTHFISTMPMRELVEKLDPPTPELRKTAAKLNYRDFLTVALVVDQKEVFPDNWIYIHDPDVKVGRIQNFKNWSPEMVPDESKTCIGLEYFCFEGDDLWTMSDEDLISLGRTELDKLGLVDAAKVEGGSVVRMPKAYPIYDDIYSEVVNEIREFVEGLGNIQLVGRNGMHKYNNQDHSMYTAMLAVENIMGGNFDVWTVNVDQEYHEELTEEEAKAYGDLSTIEATQPRVPVAVDADAQIEGALIRAFSRLDKLAFGTAIGTVSGLSLMALTLLLVFKGGDVVGPNLSLLGQYFIGFTVSPAGAFIGLLYGFLWGFSLGWFIAYLRNLILGAHIYFVRRRAEADALRNFLNFI